MTLPAALVPEIAVPMGAAAVLCALLGIGQITLRARAARSHGVLTLGGIAVMSTLIIVLAGIAAGVATGGEAVTIAVLLLSALPVLIFGVMRDLGRPRARGAGRAAALLSAVLAAAGLGVWVPRLDLPGVDALVSIVPVAVAVTIFVAASFVRAMRMIDGHTMIAALTAMFSALGLALMAHQAGLGQLVPVAAAVSGALGGLLMLNLGTRRLLPGRTGALGIAHLLVWLSVSVMALSPDAAFGAILLILFWPVADAVQQALHHVLPERRDSLSPKLLLHRRIRGLLSRTRLCARRAALSDALTTLIMLPLIVAPVLAGVMLWDAPAMAYLALCLFAVVFEAAEPVLVRLSSQGAQAGAPGPGMGALPVLPDPDPETEPGGTVVSALSGMFIEDGYSVNVEIFRRRDSDRWMIETDDGENLPVRWQQTFDSDEDAWQAFLHTVRYETMDALSGRYQVRNR